MKSTDTMVYEAYVENVRTVLRGAESNEDTPEANAGKAALVTLIADALYNLNRVANALDRAATDGK